MGLLFKNISELSLDLMIGNLAILNVTVVDYRLIEYQYVMW